MNYDKMYQRMIRRVRWKNIQGGFGWPGKPVDASAVTHYPNILAEIEAYTGWLHIPAEFAAVSQEVMAAVVEDGEELSVVELFGVCRLYGRKLAYIKAPTLQMVDPSTNKGKYRLRQLSDLLSQVDSLPSGHLWKIVQTRDTLERGEPVTYSAWRRGCDELQEEIERRNRPAIRTERRAAV